MKDTKSNQTQAQGQASADDDFLGQYEGYGTEDLNGGIPYLSICQKLTEDGVAAGRKLGEFWHTGLNISLGKTVEVIVMGWKPVWLEKNGSGRTVAYHAPDSIPIFETNIGTDAYKCVSKSGNKIERTFLIPVVLPNKEESLCMFTPSVKSLDAVRGWRKALTMNRLSSGAKAPIFSHVWKLTSTAIKQKGNDFYLISKIEKGAQITREYLLNGIEPFLALTSDPMTMLPAVKPAVAQEDFKAAEDQESYFSEEMEGGDTSLA